MSHTFRPERVPVWAELAACAVPLTVLPSAIWRVVEAAVPIIGGTHPCYPSGAPLWEQVYIPSLSALSLGVALLTFGLIRPWGEVFPRWLPLVGGRNVPLAFAVGTATLGAVAITAIMVFALFVRGEPARPLPPGCHVPGWDVLRWYLPMLAWGPLVLLVTGHYVRRRTTAGALT